MNKFHDWSLIRITFEWESAVVIFKLRDSFLTEQTITIHGVSNIEAPRMLAWGPSNSINELIVDSENTGALNIEMQTGDTIKVTGTNVDW